MMTLRACTLLGLLVGLVGGCKTCKHGTVFLTIDFDSVAASSDTLDIAVVIGSAEAQHESRRHDTRRMVDTVEIGFSSTYPVAESLTIDVVATRDGVLVGRGGIRGALENGCTALGLSVVGTGGDGAVADFPAGDRFSSSVDLAGASWHAVPVPASAAAVELRHVWGSGPDDIYVVGSSNTILHSTDRGMSWDMPLVGPDSFTGVWGSGKDDVYVVGFYDKVFRSIDQGRSWSPVPAAGNPFDFYAIWGSGSQDIYAVGEQMIIYHTSNSGASWLAQKCCTQGAHLWSVWGGPHGAGVDVYAVGDTVFKTTDGGASWTEQAPSPAQTLNGVWGSAWDDVYAVGNSDTILHTSDGGSHWEPQASGTQGANLLAVWGSDRGDVYVVGSGGTILHSVDGGATWIRATSPTTANLGGIWGSSGVDIYVVGEMGTVLHWP